MAALNAAHPNSLGGVGGSKRPEGAEDESVEDTRTDFGFAVFTAIDAVIQFTLLDINKIYELPADEFFAYTDYIKAREERKAAEIRKIQRR